MPPNNFMEVYNLIRQDNFCFLSQVGMTFISCFCPPDGIDTFPDLTYTIDGVSYLMPASSYVSRDGSRCTVEIAAHRSWNYWILGLNFFEQYYTVFDKTNMKIGFSVSIHNDVESYQQLGMGQTNLLQRAQAAEGVMQSLYGSVEWKKFVRQIPETQHLIAGALLVVAAISSLITHHKGKKLIKEKKSEKRTNDEYLKA